MKFNMGNAQELLVDDLELLLREISDFCGVSEANRGEIPKILENYLLYVAKTGNTVFPWPQVRPLFRHKMQSSIATFSAEPMAMENTVYERFDLFRAAPFTIQRLSELITDPKRHYKLKEKYLFALEKAVYVVSTVEPTPVRDGDEELEANGNADNDNSVGDGEVSYHELNSTFNVTPPDAQTLALAAADDVATACPSVELEATNETPLLAIPTAGNEMNEAPLEVQSTEEMTVTVSCEATGDTMVIENKVLPSESVLVEENNLSGSNEPDITVSNEKTEIESSEPQITGPTEMESSEFVEPESTTPKEPVQQNPVIELETEAPLQQPEVEPAELIKFEAKVDDAGVPAENNDIVQQPNAEVDSTSEVGAGDTCINAVSLAAEIEEPQTGEAEPPALALVPEESVVSAEEVINITAEPSEQRSEKVQEEEDEKMEVDDSQPATA